MSDNFVVEIISSGSSGNCYLINQELIIDLGVPYKSIKDVIKNVKMILLTHLHNDHLAKDTLRTILVKHPSIKVIAPDYIIENFEHWISLSPVFRDCFINIQNEPMIEINDYKISPIKLYHDIDQTGYRILKNNKKLIFATDTYTLQGITALDYDVAIIEANYEEQAIIKLIEQAQANNEYTHLINVADSHLSVQQALQFVTDNNIKKWYPVHIGNSTRTQVIDHINKKKGIFDYELS
jgi:ribonuclease BN (tRNA processing enzyme)